MKAGATCLFLLVPLAACSSMPDSSQASRAGVERLFETFNRHDAVAMRALYAPDAIHVSPAFCTPKRGPDEIAAVYQGLFTSLPDVRDEVVQIVAEGDHAAVRFVAHSGALKPSPTMPIAAFIQFRDGLIVREET
jgi:ketosteroid isomerase-like protein